MNAPFNCFTGIAVAMLLFSAPGAYAHTSFNNPLPLLVLSAQQCEHDALLVWQTEYEVSLDYYEIERSTDACHYSSIGRVKALNEATRHTYQFRDEQAEGQAKPQYYYRIRYADVDKNVFYTPVVRVSFPRVPVNAASLYPNPVYCTSTLQLTLARAGHIDVRIINNIGILLRSSAYELPGGTSLLPFSPGEWPRGMYYVQIHGDAFDKTVAFVRP